MKKIVGISLFIFLAAVTSVIATGFFFSSENPIKSEPGSLLPEGAGSVILNAQETAKHNSQDDCWVIISGKVYNLTGYLDAHPGDVSTIFPYCGKDGSQGFVTKDEKKPKTHSEYAGSLLANYYLGDFNQEINRLLLPIGNASAPTSAPNVAAVDSGANIILSAAEVGKHNLAKDCWLIMNAKIYNVTGYLGAHPGGVGAIAPYCGKDGAPAFQGLPHSSYAASLLAGYLIGNLDQAISTAQVQQNIQNTAQITPPPRRGGDDDEEDDKEDDD